MIKNENCLPTSLRTKRRIVSPGEFKRKERHWAVGEKERRVLGLVWFCFDLVGVGFFFLQGKGGGSRGKANNWKSRDKPPSPKHPGASPTPPCPKEEAIRLTLFAELFFFIIPWCAALEGDGGGGDQRGAPGSLLLGRAWLGNTQGTSSYSLSVFTLCRSQKLSSYIKTSPPL